jgi:hypothetical protein
MYLEEERDRKIPRGQVRVPGRQAAVNILHEPAIPPMRISGMPFLSCHVVASLRLYIGGLCGSDNLNIE